MVLKKLRSTLTHSLKTSKMNYSIYLVLNENIVHNRSVTSISLIGLNYLTDNLLNTTQNLMLRIH